MLKDRNFLAAQQQQQQQQLAQQRLIELIAQQIPTFQLQSQNNNSKLIKVYTA